NVSSLQFADVMPGRTIRPTMAPRKEINLAAALERILIDQFAPASVVVDERGDVVYFCGHTGKYLEPSSGAPSTNVVSMARKGLRLNLRSALHQAVRGRKEVVLDRISVQTNGHTQRIALTVRPLVEFGEESNLFLIVFRDLPESRKKDSRAKPA